MIPSAHRTGARDDGPPPPADLLARLPATDTITRRLVRLAAEANDYRKLLRLGSV